MKYKGIEKTSLNKLQADVLLIPAYSDFADVPFKWIIDICKRDGFKAEQGKSLAVPLTDSSLGNVWKVILYGMGDRNTADGESARRGAASAVKKLGNGECNKVVLLPPKGYAAEALEGAILGAYRFSKYKDNKTHDISLKILDVDGTLDSQKLERAALLASHVNRARWLVDEQPSEKTPSLLAEIFKSDAEKAGLRVAVKMKKDLEREGFGGISAVSRGSLNDPCLVEIYNDSSENSLCLVGKGITFDSGGMDIKNRSQMKYMKQDMAGAAAVVYGAISAASNGLNIPTRVLVPLAENMPGPEAYKPGDIVKMFDGTTVEIKDTDAEGRMILADAIALSLSYNPREIVELSTLTGGCQYTLGDFCAGLYTRFDDLAEKLLVSSAMSGEKLWRLPFFKEFDDEMKGKISDMKNVGEGRAQVLTAAAFLNSFAKGAPFAHLDIGGCAFTEGKPLLPYFSESSATGYGVRLLHHYLLSR